jgi:hypothetical protein
MLLKQLIITVFLLIALNLSFQPGQFNFNSKRQVIEYVIEYKEDANTTNLLNINQNIKLQRIVSFTIQIMMIDKYETYYDTS